MSPYLWILLLVFLVLVGYYLVVLLNPEYLVRDKVSLNSVKTIKAADLDHPSSPRYYYEGWFFVDANVPVDTDNVLFNRGRDFLCCLKGSTLKVYVNCPETTTIDSGVVSGATNEVISLANVPFQKWTHVVLHVDGAQIDAYVDGKLAQSNRFSSSVLSTETTDLTYGNKHTQGTLVRFRRPATNTNPQNVYSSYMMGSGEGSAIGVLPQTHVNVQVTKNNQVKVNQRIF
jgi:hypothetical protein